MSLNAGEAFTVADLDVSPIESGTSVLLTGEDSDALRTVFHRLTAAADDERSILLVTDTRARQARNELEAARTGAGDRATILAGDGPASGNDVSHIDDIGDLTGLGMQLSSEIAESQQTAERHRAGILLCSSICSEVDDTRSVYRFLNSNFLTPLRRSQMIGVCALDTSADIGADMHSTISGMKTSFKAHVAVEPNGANGATLDVSGLTGPDESVDVQL